MQVCKSTYVGHLLGVSTVQVQEHFSRQIAVACFDGMNSYFIFSLPISYVLRSNSEAACAMQETQKPNKEIDRLEDKSSTLGLLVTTVEENG